LDFRDFFRAFGLPSCFFLFVFCFFIFFLTSFFLPFFFFSRFSTCVFFSHRGPQKRVLFPPCGLVFFVFLSLLCSFGFYPCIFVSMSRSCANPRFFFLLCFCFVRRSISCTLTLKLCAPSSPLKAFLYSLFLSAPHPFGSGRFDVVQDDTLPTFFFNVPLFLIFPNKTSAPVLLS